MWGRDQVLARRVSLIGWTAISAVTAVVWLLIGVIGQDFDPPWFLWTVAAGGLLTGAIWLLTGRSR